MVPAGRFAAGNRAPMRPEQKDPYGAIPGCCSLPFCFGEGTKDTQLRMNKSSGTFTNGKTRSFHLFSVAYAEEQRIDSKTVGKLYKYPDGNNAVSITKCGNYEESANGSQRAYKSCIRSCTGT
jgi:hypothetical protein